MTPEQAVDLMKIIDVFPFYFGIIVGLLLLIWLKK